MNKTSTELKIKEVSIRRLENPKKNEVIQPSNESILAILNYSKALCIQPSDSLKNIEWILN